MARDTSLIPAGTPLYGFYNPNDYAIREYIDLVGGRAIRDIESDDMYAFWGDMFRVDDEIIEVCETAGYTDSADCFVWSRDIGTARSELIDAVRQEYNSMRCELVEQVKRDPKLIVPAVNPSGVE